MMQFASSNKLCCIIVLLSL